MAAKFNYKAISQSVVTSPIGAKRVQTVMEKKFLEAKTKFIQDFKGHDVSLEIEFSQNAPEADSNISGTLGGKGNLFSFIGFKAGSDPIGKVVSILQSGLKIARTKTEGTVKGGKPAIVYNFSLRVPREDLEAATQFEWQPGSWLYSIERGISGLGNYIRGRFLNSRSGGALQSKNPVRELEYKKPKGGYFQTMLRNFGNYFK